MSAAEDLADLVFAFVVVGLISSCLLWLAGRGGGGDGGEGGPAMGFRDWVDTGEAPGGSPSADEVYAALETSVRLQSHYAFLLNQYDGGRRLTFASAAEWIERLRAVRVDEAGAGASPPPPPPPTPDVVTCRRCGTRYFRHPDGRPPMCGQCQAPVF